jgi:hypothetical protein
VPWQLEAKVLKVALRDGLQWERLSNSARRDRAYWCYALDVWS